MKKEFVKELLKEKDLSKEETIDEIVKAINDDENSVLANKEAKWEEKSKKIQDDLAIAKTELDKHIKEKDLTKKELDELKTKYEGTKVEADKTKKEKFVLKAISRELDDESLEDIIDLASKRVSETKKFEDAVKEVAEKYNFNKTDPAKTPAKPATGVTAKANQPAEKDKKLDQKDWITSFTQGSRNSFWGKK